jgi:hypothetical protein
MKANDAFPSKFLKAADLGTRRVVVTISHVEVEKFDDGDRPCVFFQGKDKGLVLNKTNFNTIADITGEEDSDDWAGKRITLYATKTEYQGKRVDAIRVDDTPKDEDKPRRATPAPAPEPDHDAFGDDEPPF